MTLLEAIETEVSNLSTRVRFEYAGNLEEANATIFDQINSGEFPVCLVLAFDIVDNRAQGIVSDAEISVLFLDRKEGQATIDAKTSEVDTQIIAPMRAISREFFNRLEANDIIEEDGIVSVTNRNVYEPIADAHLYGNWAVATVKFTEEISLCVPD